MEVATQLDVEWIQDEIGYLDLAGEQALPYVQEQLPEINQHIREKGALLFRNTGLQTVESFLDFTHLFSKQLLTYEHQSSPRTHLKDRVYTSTEYPPEAFIPLHNENAYTESYPNRILFFSQKAALTGGETPLANSQTIYQHIPAEIRQQFVDKQLKYIRCFPPHLGVDWKTTFQVQTMEELLAHFEQYKIGHCWTKQNILKTWETLPAVCQHPIHQRPIWFNQAHLFHQAALPAEVKGYLLETYGPYDLPRTVTFADDTLIEDEMIEIINETYRQHQICFPWQQGDVLILDNLQYAHGRNPFTGIRKVLVAMYNETL